MAPERIREFKVNLMLVCFKGGKFNNVFTKSKVMPHCNYELEITAVWEKQ
jgi:hypothetical protein